MDTQQEQHIYTTDNNIKERRSNYDVRSEKSTKEVNDQQIKYSVIRLREMDLNRKLELLFSRECYALAQSIVDDAVNEANNNNDIRYDEQEQNKQLKSSSESSPQQENEKIKSYTTQAIASSNTPHTNTVNKSSKRKLSPLQVYVHKCYGDYLFHNERWTEAMTQYIDTIGALEPSYVIQKFSGVNVQEHLENEYYHHHHNDEDKIQKVSFNNELLVELTRYLEALHHIDCAKDVLDTTYTTLLIHCYLRQQQQQQHLQKEEEEHDKLLHFVKRNDVRFNALHAIDVCRAHHATRAASTLAEKYALNLIHVNIVLYDEANAHKALELIRMMNVDEAEEALLTMGKDLIAAAPRQTTELCTELCVHWSGPPRRLTNLLSTKDINSIIINTTSNGVTQYEHINKLYETDKVAHRAHASNFIRIFVNSPRCLFHFLRAVIASGVYDDIITTKTPPPEKEENNDSDQGTKNCEFEEEQEHNSNIEHSNMINTAMKEADNKDNNSTRYLHNIHGHLYNTLFELYLTPTLQTHLGPDNHREQNNRKVNNCKDKSNKNNNEYNSSSSNARKECNDVTNNTNNISSTTAMDDSVCRLCTNEEVVKKNNSNDNTCNYEKENQIVTTRENKTIDTTETNATEKELFNTAQKQSTKSSSISSPEATSEKQENNDTFPDEPLELRQMQALQFLHMYKNKYDAT